MFAACRHIKSNGLRCQSPALRGHQFCYYHVHTRSVAADTAREDLRLPLIDDPSAVQLSVSQIVHAMFARQITPKEAGIALYAIQLCSQSVCNDADDPTDIVRSAIRTADGDEIAHPLCVPDEDDEDNNEDCSNCGHRRTCNDYQPTERDEQFDQREDEQIAEEENFGDDESGEEENGPEKTDAKETGAEVTGDPRGPHPSSAGVGEISTIPSPSTSVPDPPPPRAIPETQTQIPHPSIYPEPRAGSSAPAPIPSA